MSTVSNVISKTMSVEAAAREALGSPAVLTEFLEASQSHQEELRYASYQVLMVISEQRPAALYSHWGRFADMLGSTNSSFQAIAIKVLANLVAVDAEGRFESIFGRYFGILGGDKTVTAAYIAGNAWKIALAKPGLRAKVTDRLLGIDLVHRGKQRDLIKGHAIESFGHYFGEADAEDKKRMLAFARTEASNRSPRTKKAAKAFLNEFE